MDKPDKMRVTISFIVDDAHLYEVDELDTYMDGYRWLWDNDRSAAMDAFYDDDNPILVNVEPLAPKAQSKSNNKEQ